MTLETEVKGDKCRIVAPVCSERQAGQLIAAGANELYCGAMFHDWVELFGTGELVSRRQSRMSHITAPEDLAALAAYCKSQMVPLYLALNARYTRFQQEKVLQLVRMWEELGGSGIIVTDFWLLLVLQQQGSKLVRHLSLLAGAYNGQTANFFKDLGVSRLILPRHVSLTEMTALIASCPDIEYELLVLNQKCQFIDGMCGFYHGERFPHGEKCFFDYMLPNGNEKPVVTVDDPDFEGHGCELDWRTTAGPVQQLVREDHFSPHCAACLVARIRQAGIRYLKIAGRAYETEQLVHSVKFLKQALSLFEKHGRCPETQSAIKSLYEKTFGRSCSGEKCYYSSGFSEGH